jgi:PilZ domain-containing protein
MNSRERRIDPRVSVAVPLRFRALNVQNATEQIAESQNISQRGLFFFTSVPLKVGTPVELSLRMPPAISGNVSSDVRCVGRVVHVRENGALGGKLGVGIHIERYEAAAAMRERWAS